MDPSIKRRSIAYRCLLASAAIVAVLLYAYGTGDFEAGAVPTSSGSAAGAGTENWNFESGDFTGWRTRARGSGAWHVYADGTKPPDPTDSDPNFPFKVPQPPEGRFAAVTDMSAPGARILYRDVQLDGRVKLRLTLFYNNVGEFSPPVSLDFNGCEANQQFRVDLTDPAAPVDSLAAKHVLATIFQTEPGDPDTLDPRAITFDLSRWAGKKVRVRFAQVDNRGPLRTGVDDVKLDAVGS
jgi:hypothetical protein